MKTLVGLLLFLVSANSILLAQDRTPRVNTRQGVQRARIVEGKQNGEITPVERAALRHEQRHIRRSERRAKADGKVTQRERKRLDIQQDRASRHIRKAKHNQLQSN